MESSTERGKVKFSYSSVSSFVVAVIVSSLAIIIIHGPQECQTLFQTFSVPQSQRGWNFHAFLCTNLLLKGPIIFHFVSGSPIIMPNSSVVPNFAEIASWQRDATAGDNNDTSSSGSFEDSSEPTSTKVICASSTSCTSPSSPTQNETRIVRKMKSEKERLRLELLKQIKSLDHMKCFPKVLCGLSVDSSKSSTGIDSHLVRSYIQLMRTAKPEDDSSEESKPSIDSTKDALSLFLMKSGILPAKKKRRKDASISASSSEEEEEDDDDPLTLEDQQTIPYKSSIERKNDQLKEFLKLSKRKLAISDGGGGSDDGLDDSFISQNHTYINPLEFSHQKGYNTRPVLYMSTGQNPNENSGDGGAGGESETTSTITGQIGSLVSSWVPWLSLSFGADSFEKDPFFSGAKSKKTTTSEISEQSQKEAWKKEFDKLTYFMKLKKEIERTKAKFKKRKLGRMNDENSEGANAYDDLVLPHDEIGGGVEMNDYADYYEDADYITNGRLSRDLKVSSTDSEMVIYSTAVEIGKKLKDPRQCDYLYNGCPVPYSELLKIITSIRKDIKEEDETVEMLSKEMEDYLPSKTKLTPKQRVSQASASTTNIAPANAKNKKKTQLKPSRNNQLHHKKQQLKYTTQPIHNNNKLHGNKKQTTQHQQQQQKSPITKISHILPNGEKVEINVQLSGSGADGYSAHGDEQFDQEAAEFQADAGEEIGDETEYLAEEESLFDEDNEDDENTLLSQAQVDPDPNISSPEDPAISASYELDDEKQDGDDFRKPTPLEIFNKISLKGAHDQITTTTTQAPKPKYKVTKRPPPSTKRPKPKPTTLKPSISATTEKKPIWSKGTTKPTKRPSTVRTARPTPRNPPPVNKLKPLMQSYIHSSSVEDDEKSMESTITRPTSKRPTTKSKPNTITKIVSSPNNKVKAPNKKPITSQKRNDTKTSQPSKRTTTTQKPTSLSPSSTKDKSKTSAPRNKKKPTQTTRRPTTTKKPPPSTSKSQVNTTPRYKISKTSPPRPSSVHKNETNTKLSANSSPNKTNTKSTNNSSSSTTKKPHQGSLPPSKGTKSPHLKRKPDNRKPISTVTTPMTTSQTHSTASTTTLAPLAMFTKSVMDDVIQEFYHKKHIQYAIPPESPSTGTGTNVNDQKKHSQKIGNNGISESQLVQIGSEGSSSPTLGDDESFISIETEASGELKLHSGNKSKKDQLGSSTTTNNGGSATGEPSESSGSSSSDTINKNKRISGESSSSESSNKKRIKYKNPKLPHLVILNSSTLDIPNPIALSDESSGVSVGSKKKPLSSKSPGYSISNKKPTTPGTNPLDLPPYVFQPDSAEYPYWVPPPVPQ